MKMVFKSFIDIFFNLIRCQNESLQSKILKQFQVRSLLFLRCFSYMFLLHLFENSSLSN
nr:hypothetical protein [Dinophyceae sp. MRD-151]